MFLPHGAGVSTVAGDNLKLKTRTSPEYNAQHAFQLAPDEIWVFAFVFLGSCVARVSSSHLVEPNGARRTRPEWAGENLAGGEASTAQPGAAQPPDRAANRNKGSGVIGRGGGSHLPKVL